MFHRSATIVTLVTIAMTSAPLAHGQGAAGRAGVAAAVRGDVVLIAAAPQQTARAVGENVRSGDPVYLGDTIETGPDSGLQIMLMDETIFTIGPDAALIIDEFVYDPETSAGKVTASVLKGAFRFVSGRVAKEEPRNMNVKTPVGTIGIRGTSAAGRVIPANPADPNSEVTADIVLLGPGVDNNANERAGRIIVSNADTSVEISRSGFGTSIAGIGAPPTVPVRFDPGVVSSLTGDLGTNGGARPAARSAAAPGGNTPPADGDGNQPGGGNARSDNDGASGARPAGPAGPNSGGPDGAGPADGPVTAGGAPTGGAPIVGGGIGLGQAAALSGQNIGTGVVNAGLLNQIGTAQNQTQKQLFAAVEQSGVSFNNAITSFEQLQSIESGTATFAFNSIALLRGPGSTVGDGGSYDASAVIDFGARTIDLKITNVLYTINGSGGHTFVFDEGIGNGPNDNYSNDTGLAANTWNSTDNAVDFTTAPTGGHLVEIQAQINNDLNTGVIAHNAGIDVKITHAGAVIQGGKTVVGQ